MLHLRSCLLAWLLLTASSFLAVQGQPVKLEAGPMLGHTELRSAEIWIQMSATVPPGALQLVLNGGKKLPARKEDNAFKAIYKFTADHLQPGSQYTYTVQLQGKTLASGTFKTQSLWQWRSQAPDFSFLAGSCTYFNEPEYDRPGKPYGGDSSIFETMARENADFMLWLGDNWYTREVDYYSEAGLTRRPARERAMPVLQPLLKKMAHYAIWDDHDYGPNDIDRSYILKEASRRTFRNFWANPSYGLQEQGIFTKFTWNDIDVFMLDDRWFRDNDDLKDTVAGRSTRRTMFGALQMNWLKNALLQSRGNSNISFRIIATGSQVLNTVSPFDCFCQYTEEFREFMDFLAEHRIDGVVFLTGDRHHSEIIKRERPGAYPLYDITSSPLTSGTHRFGASEQQNPLRVLGVDQKQNYARLTISGKGAERRLQVQYLGVKGEKLGEWSATLRELSHPK